MIVLCVCFIRLMALILADHALKKKLLEAKISVLIIVYLIYNDLFAPYSTREVRLKLVRILTHNALHVITTSFTF